MQASRSVFMLLGVVSSLTLMPGPRLMADEGAEHEVEKAVETANAWLTLVDTGAYAQSWETVAAYFKGAVKKEAWEGQLAAVRAPLGKRLLRTLKSSQYSTTLPGAPDGEYVVIEYETSFEKKLAAVETVIPMREPDGTWKVAGYYIK